MNSKSLSCAVRVFSVLVLAFGTGALALGQVQFSGLINDYTSSSVKGGPWELHGSWTLDVLLRGTSSQANFTVDMTMSNYGATSSGAVDPTKPGNTPHVHHVVLKDVTIQWDMDGCPTFPAPTNNNFGFQFTAPVSLITGNGQPAPFDKTVPPQSPLTVCVTGVMGEAGSVAFSNITLEFGAPANTHFGVGTVIHGVVTNPNRHSDESQR